MKKNTQAFANQLLLCLLVTITFGGSVGLGTVWLRHQISLTANTNRRLAAQVREIERRVAETKTLVETAEGPEALRRLNADFRLGLVPASDSQLMHVISDPVERMRERARERDREGVAPINVTLALSR